MQQRSLGKAGPHLRNPGRRMQQSSTGAVKTSQERIMSIRNRATEVRNAPSVQAAPAPGQARPDRRMCVQAAPAPGQARPDRRMLSGTDLGDGSMRVGESSRRRAKPQPAAERSRNPHPRWRRPHDDGGGSGILEAAPAESMEATTPLDEATLHTAPRGATGSATSPRWRSQHTARSTPPVRPPPMPRSPIWT
jgi:hypothetical protein